MTWTVDMKQTIRVDEGNRMGSLVGSGNMVRGPPGFPGPPGPTGPTGSVLLYSSFQYQFKTPVGDHLVQLFSLYFPDLFFFF